MHSSRKKFGSHVQKSVSFIFYFLKKNPQPKKENLLRGPNLIEITEKNNSIKNLTPKKISVVINKLYFLIEIYK